MNADRHDLVKLWQTEMEDRTPEAVLAWAAAEFPGSGRWWWECPEHRECGLHAQAASVSSIRGART